MSRMHSLTSKSGGKFLATIKLIVCGSSNASNISGEVPNKVITMTI